MHKLRFSARCFAASCLAPWRPFLMGPMLMATVACHDLSGLTGTQQLPSGIPNPSVYHTAAGALALYQTTLVAFQYSTGDSTAGIGSNKTATTPGALVDFVLTSGLLTDELQAGNLGCTGIVCSAVTIDDEDARHMSSYQNNNVSVYGYNELQGVRNDAALGIGALATYDSSASPALRGHLYALAGYAELLLADLYCSGVPLSTITFNGDFTYAAGSSTTQVYQAALAQFDTALTLSSDSARIENLAWVGRSRVLLALGSFPQAAQAAAHVPDGFSYQFLVDWTGGYGIAGKSLFNPSGNGGQGYVTVADQEGLNGLPFISGEDPRTASQVASTNAFGVPQYVPVKYGGATPGIFPITVADGIEARLIQAEAALHAGDVAGYLTQLNTARTLAAPSLPALADPGRALSDSAADSARVDLLFRERAYDLLLTGHRQGDLRRLVRQYHRNQARVYPTGLYPVGNSSSYGSDVTVPIPIGDESPNPLFHGCLSGGA